MVLLNAGALLLFGMWVLTQIIFIDILGFRFVIKYNQIAFLTCGPAIKDNPRTPDHVTLCYKSYF